MIKLLAGMLVTLVLSLSVHVVMLQVLHVPFPEFAGVSAWAPLLNTALAVLALIVLCRAAKPDLARFAKLTQCLIVFVLFAMLKESVRGILMNGVVTRGWGFDIVAGLPGLTAAFVVVSLAVLLAPLLHSLWAKIAGATAIGAMTIFAVRPALGILFAPALKAVAHLDHAEVYGFPYGWQVLLPAYMSYAEPVISCMCLASLMWGCLSAHRKTRILQFALLILSLKGMLLPTFTYSFYSKLKLPMAMLSQSQFFLETLALAVLTALVWEYSQRSKSVAKST